MHDLGIGEPLTWAPPPSCCAGLDLPGPDPDDIDLDAAGRLIVTGRLPVAEAAAPAGHHRRPCPAHTRPHPPARSPVGPVPGEQRITDLAAQLGGSQANISAHLIKLKKSGLITSRTQGRAVYYRLTRPELGALLQAPGQLLVTAGQQATGEKDRPVRTTSRPM